MALACISADSGQRAPDNGNRAALTLLVLCLLMVMLLFPAKLHAEDRELGEIFARRGVAGAMVISSLAGRNRFIHDSGRSHRRYPAASTFKILNTLVAVEEGAVRGKDEIVRWDGRLHDFPDWNRDQTLESAFRSSCVWYYQELARRVGPARYRAYIDTCSYGTLAEQFDATAFWLDGSLRISAVGQVEFLRRLCNRELPFGAKAYETLRDIMIVEKTPRLTLRAKTGWAARGATPQVGWYVGWLETDGETWLFAMNMDVRDPSELPLRQQIVREALQAKHLID